MSPRSSGITATANTIRSAAMNGVSAASTPPRRATSSKPSGFESEALSTEKPKRRPERDLDIAAEHQIAPGGFLDPPLRFARRQLLGEERDEQHRRQHQHADERAPTPMPIQFPVELHRVLRPSRRTLVPGVRRNRAAKRLCGSPPA